MPEVRGKHTMKLKHVEYYRVRVFFSNIFSILHIYLYNFELNDILMYLKYLEIDDIPQLHKLLYCDRPVVLAGLQGCVNLGIADVCRTKRPIQDIHANGTGTGT